jgi:hypothetical protein
MDRHEAARHVVGDRRCRRLDAERRVDRPRDHHDGGFGVEDDEIVFHFVQSGDDQDPTTPNPGGTSANGLDADLNDGEIFIEDVEAETVDAASVDWLVAVEPVIVVVMPARPNAPRR